MSFFTCMKSGFVTIFSFYDWGDSRCFENNSSQSQGQQLTTKKQHKTLKKKKKKKRLINQPARGAIRENWLFFVFPLQIPYHVKRAASGHEAVTMSTKDTVSCFVAMATYLDVRYERLIPFHADDEGAVHVQFSANKRFRSTKLQVLSSSFGSEKEHALTFGDRTKSDQQNWKELLKFLKLCDQCRVPTHTSWLPWFFQGTRANF